MGFKCGIVVEPNVGDVAVPEARLDVIADIGGSAQKIPARMNFVDIAGLVRGAINSSPISARQTLCSMCCAVLMMMTSPMLKA